LSGYRLHPPTPTHSSLQCGRTGSVRPTIGPSASHLRGLTEPLFGPYLGPLLARRLDAPYLPLTDSKWTVHESYGPGMTRTVRHLHCFHCFHFVRSLYICSKPLFNKGQRENYTIVFRGTLLCIFIVNLAAIPTKS